MTTSTGAPAPDPALQGHYVGIATRFVSFLIDVFMIAVLFSVGGHVIDYVLSVLLSKPVQFSDTSTVARVALVLWAFVYCAYPLSASGRTLGMAALGVRAVRADGRDLDTRQAIVRVLVFPLSFLLFGLGFVLILLRRDRRALHALSASTAVVYAWDARAGRLRFLLKR